MLIINFKNNIPQQNHYSYSVVGNNKSNKIKFILDKYQDEVDLSEFIPYLQIEANGGMFLDIFPLTSSVQGSELEIIWELKKKTTQFANVSCQLKFKKADNDTFIVWQSAIVSLELLRSINAEEEMPDVMPTVIERIDEELDDHEERIEELENGQGINEIVVGNPSDYENENGVKKLIRKEDEEGAIHETYVIDKDHIPHEFVDSEPTSTNNGTQLNTSAKVKSDLSRYEDVFGEAVIEPLNNAIYTVYYNKNGEITKAIRVGVASRYGALEITGLEPNKEIKLTVGSYFRYDENDEKVFDSSCYLYIEDKNHEGNFFEITEEKQEFNLVADNSGRIYIDNDASSIVEEGEVFGRLFVYGFEGEVAEHTEYHAKQLAKKEEVEEVQQEVVETNERLGQAEDRIGACEDSIETINDEIDDINSKMGDVQIFDRTSLPTPSEQYLKKIFRVNGVLFQCVKVGENLDETFDFANVSGTSEITASSFNDFAEQVSEGFAENVELYDNNEWFDFIPVQIIQSDEKYYDTNSKLDLHNVSFFTENELDNCYIDAIYIRDGGDWSWDNEEFDFSVNGVQQIAYTTQNHINILGNDGNTYGATCDNDTDEIMFSIYNVNAQLFNSEALPFLLENQEVQPIVKLFRNNGDIRLGNSSQIGQFIFHTKTGIPFHEVRVELQAWSSTKSSAVKMVLGSSMASVVIPKGETRTLTVVDEGEGNTLFTLTTEKVGNQDPRVIIKSMYIRMGEASYEWVAVGGGAESDFDVVVKEMKFIQKEGATFRCYKSYISGYQEGVYCKNDPKDCDFVIKTTPISSKVEDAIRQGTFVIRFDYSMPYKAKELIRQKGMGVYSYSHNFFNKNKDTGIFIENKFANIRKNALVFVEPSDIVVKENGEKIIVKKLSIKDLTNKFYFVNEAINQLSDEHPSLDGLFGLLEDVKVGGAIKEAGESHFNLLNRGNLFYYFSRGGSTILESSQTMREGVPKPFNTPNKDMKMLNYWCPLICPTQIQIANIYSPFDRMYIQTYYEYSDEGEGERIVRDLSGKKTYKNLWGVSVKPRCAIIDINYENKTSGNIWQKTYSLSKKRLWIRPADCFSLGDSENLAVIFRYGVSKKI